MRIFLLLLCLVCAPAAHALRCDGNLTHDGDYEYQVRERCGAPFWTDTRVKYEGFGTKEQQVLREVRYTSWYYNFGSNQFIVRLVFRDGRLNGEERLGRGVDELGTSCDPLHFARGLSAGEVIAHCSEPVQRNVVPTYVSRTAPAFPLPGAGPIRNQPPESYRIDQGEEYREDWIYDFGGDRIYVVQFIDDRVSGFESRRR